MEVWNQTPSFLHTNLILNFLQLVLNGIRFIIRFHMKCGTYMVLIAFKPLLETWRPHFYRGPSDILQTRTMGGPGVQCKVSA